MVDGPRTTGRLRAGVPIAEILGDICRRLLFGRHLCGRLLVAGHHHLVDCRYHVWLGRQVPCANV